MGQVADQELVQAAQGPTAPSQVESKPPAAGDDAAPHGGAPGLGGTAGVDGGWFGPLGRACAELERFWRRASVRENLFASVLLLIIALLSAMLFGVSEKFENLRAVREARLQLIEQKQQLLQTFADAIPRNLSIANEYRSLQLWLDAHPPAAGPGDAAAGIEAQREEKLDQMRELREEWRDGNHYLTACQLVEVRFPDSAGHAATLRECLDLLTELRLSNSEQLLGTLDDILARAPSGSALAPEVSAAGPGMAGRRDGALEVWSERFRGELTHARGWIEASRSREGEERTEALSNAALALRLALVRAVDILYVETMREMGMEIQSENQRLGLDSPDAAR